MTNGSRPGSKQRPSKEVREADLFLKYSGEFLNWLQKNAKAIFVVAGALVLTGTLYAAYNWWNQKKEYAAQEALFAVEKSYFTLKEKYDAAKAEYERLQEEKSKNKAKGGVEKPADYPSGDLTADYGDILKRFEGFMAAHRGTNAEVMAALQAARIYSDYQNYEAAEKLLAPVVERGEGVGLLRALSMTMLGTMAEAQGRCEKAIEHWQGVLSLQTAGVFHSDVLLRQALCYESLSNKEKAKEIYGKLGADFADSQAGRRAKSYLRWLELQGE